MVLTFQLAIRRAGGFDTVLIVLVGADILLTCQDKSLSFTHPVKQMSVDGTAPYWLGAAQLAAGGSCPVRYEDLSHRRKWPLALVSYVNRIELITGNCHSPF